MSNNNNALSSTTTTTTTTTMATTTIVTATGVVGLALIYVLGRRLLISSSSSNKGNNESEDKEKYSEPPKDSKFKYIYNSKYKIRYTDDYCTKTLADDHDSSSSKTTTTTLIFVHGFLGCLETWNPIKEILLDENTTCTTKLRIITLDLLGSGFSSKPGFEDNNEINNFVDNFGYTFESQGKALGEFIKEMDLLNDDDHGKKDKLILIGHSAGCISLCTAASGLLLHKYDSQKVHGMFMIGPGFFQYKPGFLSNPRLGWLARFLAKQISKGGGTSMLKSKSCHLDADKNLTTDLLEAFVNARNSRYSSQVVEKFVTCQESKSYDRFLEDIPVRTKVRMVWSASDKINPPNVEKVNNAIIIGSDSKIITHKVYEEGLSGHYMQHEIPNLIVDEILNFINYVCMF